MIHLIDSSTLPQTFLTFWECWISQKMPKFDAFRGCRCPKRKIPFSFASCARNTSKNMLISQFGHREGTFLTYEIYSSKIFFRGCLDLSVGDKCSNINHFMFPLIKSQSESQFVGNFKILRILLFFSYFLHFWKVSRFVCWEI